MTGEEMERAIDFLLKSQANLEARIEQVNDNLSTQMGELKNRLDELAQTHSHFVQVVTRTFERQDEVNRRHEETDRRLTKAVETMAETQRGLAEDQSRTDERLNSLINTVERYISGRRGDER